MIDKYNIKIQNKNTKKIEYILSLDDYWWFKSEFDSRGKDTYYEDSEGGWNKSEYDDEGNQISFETKDGYLHYKNITFKKQISFETNDRHIKDDR